MAKGPNHQKVLAMRTIIDFRDLGGAFWLAYFPVQRRHRDLPERPVWISTPIVVLEPWEVGQELGGN